MLGIFFAHFFFQNIVIFFYWNAIEKKSNWNGKIIYKRIYLLSEISASEDFDNVDIEELGSQDSPHFAKIHHNIDTSTAETDEIDPFDSSTVTKPAEDNDHTHRLVSHQDKTENQIKVSYSKPLGESDEAEDDLDALNQNLMLGDEPVTVSEQVHLDPDPQRGKKWSYNNPYNNHPQTYYNANKNRQEYYHYAGNVVRVPSGEESRENNRKKPQKSKNRGNGRRKGKGRKGKGRNKSRNKVDINSEQADSADVGLLKYRDELTNSVLEEEDLKAKVYQKAPAKPVEFEDCSQLKCKNGGQCEEDEMKGGVRCQCKLGTEGKFCEAGKSLLSWQHRMKYT